MNINAASGTGTSQMMPPKPPEPGEIASNIASRVESGEITVDELVAQLESQFGEDAGAIVNEDGSLNIDQLTQLFEQGRADMPPPPPGGGGAAQEQAASSDIVEQILSDIESGELSTADLTEQLERMFGDSASSVLADDGSVDEDALLSLIEAGPTQSPPPPPPGSSLQGVTSAEQLLAQLQQEFGEEATDSVFNDDGSVDFDELIDLVGGAFGQGSGSSHPGLLLNVSA